MLSIQLLGKTALRWHGKPLGSQLSRKSIPLLYLLLQSETHFLTRDKLACYLWPDSTTEAARYNLRYNLWQLKKALPQCGSAPLVIAQKGGCQLSSSYPWQCDLTMIKEFQISSSSNEELLYLSQLFRGEVMEGWYLKNCGEFNDLILMDRMLCERRQVELLRTLARRYQDEGNFQLCLDTLHKITAVEPDNEEVAQAIMETYVQLGDRVGAIRYYKQFEGVLWNDLNISPNESLRDFYNRLKGGENHRSALSVPPPSQEMVLAAHGIPEIPGSLLSELIAASLEQLGAELVLDLELPYLQDLRYISSELAVAYQKHTGRPLLQEIDRVPDIRIINAFHALATHLCDDGTRHLRFVYQGQADPLSDAALVKAARNENLTVEQRAAL